MNIKDHFKNPKVVNYIIVPLVAILALSVLYIYIFEPFSGPDKINHSLKTNETVINTSTPVLTPKKGPGDILDMYEQSKEDSINNARINDDIQLSDGGTRQSNNVYVADDFYAVDDETKQMIRQLQIQEKQLDQDRKDRYNNDVSSSSYNSRNSSTRAQEKPAIDEEEAYRQSLLQGKEQMLRQYTQSNKSYSPVQENFSNNFPVKALVEFRASIYEDQYILPGDRVKLVITKDLAYNNKLFPKGTFIYAFADIKQSRIFLDIDNIAHVPFKLVAKDITDGRLGIYSTDAGKLWLKYKDQIQGNTGNQIANDAANQANSTLIGTALKGLASFFKSNQIRERDRILLVNNHEVILTNKIEQ